MIINILRKLIVFSDLMILIVLWDDFEKFLDCTYYDWWFDRYGIKMKNNDTLVLQNQTEHKRVPFWYLIWNYDEIGGGS